MSDSPRLTFHLRFANPSVPDWQRHMIAAWLTGFFLQGILLPCLCVESDVKMKLSLTFDGLVLARMLAAYLCRETCRGWIGYAVLCYTSPAWIEGIIRLVRWWGGLL